MLNSDLVARWRSNADAANPAGPLFISGEFAEADIACDTNFITAGVICNSGHCGTACTGSAGHQCC
ncbi:MAG: DUF6229 family protein [Dokdonella sp.]